MYKKIILIIVFIVSIFLFCGCYNENLNLEIGLQFTDTFSLDYQTVTREIVLVFPDGSEDVISKVIIQARSEGWRVSSGPGSSLHYGEIKYKNNDVSVQMDDEIISGEILRAKKTFNVNDKNHKYIFTQLFGPYYYHTENDNNLYTKGYLNAKSIKYQMRQQFVYYLTENGIDYSIANEFIGNVKIAYPISWRIILPTNTVKSNCGEVSTLIQSEENKNIMLVQHQMYEGEFLAQFPLYIIWEKWPQPQPNYIFAIVFFIIIVGLVCLFVNYIIKQNRKNKIKNLMSIRKEEAQ